MSKSLAERIAECCPCRLPNVNMIAACGGICECSIGPEQGGKCGSPIHALEAEVGELERRNKNAAGLQAFATKRTEAAEALLREAPEPPRLGYHYCFMVQYRPWLARVRAAAGTKGGGGR